MKITGLVITLNEEQNIGRCLESLQKVADEIIVLDSFSTDQTQEICASFSVRFTQRAWQGYGASRNYAQSLASHPYILVLDADEVISPELQSEIIQLKPKLSQSAYTLNRLTNYCGHWIRHSGWYPDRKLRLFPKAHAQWDEKLVHEQLQVSPHISIHPLQSHLLHYSYNSIAEHIERANHYSSLMAQQWINDGKRIPKWKKWFAPAFRFFKMFVLKRGFLDGYYGYIVCRISAMEAFWRYVKFESEQKESYIFRGNEFDEMLEAIEKGEKIDMEQYKETE